MEELNASETATIDVHRVVADEVREELSSLVRLSVTESPRRWWQPRVVFTVTGPAEWIARARENIQKIERENYLAGL